MGRSVYRRLSGSHGRWATLTHTMCLAGLIAAFSTLHALFVQKSQHHQPKCFCLHLSNLIDFFYLKIKVFYWHRVSERVNRNMYKYLLYPPHQVVRVWCHQNHHEWWPLTFKSNFFFLLFRSTNSTVNRSIKWFFLWMDQLSRSFKLTYLFKMNGYFKSMDLLNEWIIDWIIDGFND